MIPTVSFADRDRREWIEARDAGLSPSAFVASIRSRLLADETREMNDADMGVRAFIDEDGDLAYEIVDITTHYTRMKASGFPLRSDLTPDNLAAHLNRYLVDAKERRRTTRDSARLLVDLLQPAYPRLLDVPVDIIPANHVNAWARPVPSGGDIIGLNRQFSRCWVWCEWFAWAWIEGPKAPFRMLDPLADEAAMKAQLEVQAPTVVMTRELARALMGENHKSSTVIELVAQTLDGAGRNSRGGLWAGLVELIAILHELGHIALGHTDWLRDMMNGYVRGNQSPVSLSQIRHRQRKNEYDADRFAAEALRSFGRDGGTPIGREFKSHILGWTALMLFALFHFAQSGSGNDSDDPDATHPIPLNRLAAFCRHMGITELGPLSHI